MPHGSTFEITAYTGITVEKSTENYHLQWHGPPHITILGWAGHTLQSQGTSNTTFFYIIYINETLTAVHAVSTVFYRNNVTLLLNASRKHTNLLKRELNDSITAVSRTVYLISAANSWFWCPLSFILYLYFYCNCVNAAYAAAVPNMRYDLITTMPAQSY